jgi:Zn-dependent M28 family amino/carboxypeptidase
MTRIRRCSTVGLAAIVASVAMGCGTADTTESPLEAALSSIALDDYTTHIRTLSSDELEGRGPSSPGEEKTIAYLKDAFEGMGLSPGNGDSFFQEVPLVSITAEPDAVLGIRGSDGTEELVYGDDFMAWTKRVRDEVEIDDSELVFVGYGIVAPEYDWNDYEGLDVEGKTVVILVNDPGFATQDTMLFSGNAMTYYGRWTYKYEEAARQGAAGALVVHETEPAAYPWGTVKNSWSGEQFDLVTADDNMSRVAIEGWLTIESARALFDRAGLDFDALKAEALKPDFEPVSMGLTASLKLENAVRRSTSNNVLAVLPGTDRADEYFVYMAHWDHLGRDESLSGDQIYNGALDNATGTAALLELAEAFASLEEAPSRSVLFLAVTAEEQGLLGSAFYATNPVVAPEKTVAALNMDGMNVIGPMRDITIIGYGNSELDAYLAEVAALYPDEGVDHVEHGEEWSQARRDAYRAERYHKPTDEFNEEWDLTGAIDDIRLYFQVGYRIANESTFPNWREGTEFKATRDAMMEGG